jgi:hypothetical protein
MSFQKLNIGISSSLVAVLEEPQQQREHRAAGEQKLHQEIGAQAARALQKLFHARRLSPPLLRDLRLVPVLLASIEAVRVARVAELLLNDVALLRLARVGAVRIFGGGKRGDREGRQG